MVLVMASSEEEAKTIARVLVEKKLAACVNLVKQVQSIFRWRGKLTEENEVMLILKTKSKQFRNLEDEIKKLHSYKVPEIIALPVISGSKDYLFWVDSETG